MTYRALEAEKSLVFGMVGGRWLGRDHSLPTYPISFCPWVSLGDIMGLGMGEIDYGSVKLCRFMVLCGEFRTLNVPECTETVGLEPIRPSQSLALLPLDILWVIQSS